MKFSIVSLNLGFWSLENVIWLRFKSTSMRKHLSFFPPIWTLLTVNANAVKKIISISMKWKFPHKCFLFFCLIALNESKALEKSITCMVLKFSNNSALHVSSFGLFVQVHLKNCVFTLFADLLWMLSWSHAKKYYRHIMMSFVDLNISSTLQLAYLYAYQLFVIQLKITNNTWRIALKRPNKCCCMLNVERQTVEKDNSAFKISTSICSLFYFIHF